MTVPAIRAPHAHALRSAAETPRAQRDGRWQGGAHGRIVDAEYELTAEDADAQARYRAASAARRPRMGVVLDLQV